jgi:hypothetical protein
VVFKFISLSKRESMDPMGPGRWRQTERQNRQGKPILTSLRKK